MSSTFGKEFDPDVALLEIDGLTVGFSQYAGGWKRSSVNVLNDLSLSVSSGEILAVLGSSGSGKSILAHAILGILPNNAYVSGDIRFGGERLTADRQAALRGNEIALVPQSVQYLDPLMRVAQQVREAVNQGDSVKVQRSAFERYGLKQEVERLYPFQLSGGMARRILVSTATVSGAKLVIADEPTPGLDQAVVKQALDQFKELADEGCAVMLITHDIESALTVSDRIAVMYAGTTVEIARVEDFTAQGDTLRHPYTKALWRGLPQNGFIPIPGSQPKAGDLPPGCTFAPRCSAASDACKEIMPSAMPLRGGMVRCIHAT